MGEELFTNESIKKIFGGSFQLTRLAIDVARHKIRSGEEVNVSLLLEEMRKNPDTYLQWGKSEQESSQE